VDRRRCAYCDEIIGVYEPVRVMLVDGSELIGSMLTLGEQLQTPGSCALHDRCYDAFARRRAEATG
jgi:hypothetical protein